jgi:kumamolisin
MSITYKPIAGSERQPKFGARHVRAAHPDEQIMVTLMLRDDPEGTANHAEEDVRRAEQFARDHHLNVAAKLPAEHIVRLSGAVRDMQHAFNVRLHHVEFEGGTYRGRTGAVYLPDNANHLDQCVTAVFGLDDRPIARPHVRRRAPAPRDQGGYTPKQIAALYGLNGALTGQGQVLGIIELGGGYTAQDLALAGVKNKVVPVGVLHGKNNPGDQDASAEVELDIQVVAAVAPAATIVVYFAPNASDQAFISALSAAIADTTYRPSVLSISWGGPESDSTQSFLTQFDAILKKAAAANITVTVAAGDDGASDGVEDGLAHVDYPASDPWALACGGTEMTSVSPLLEVVWNDGEDGGATGGGISHVWPVPSYQAAIKMAASLGGGKPGRGVPDVAGDASPNSGYIIYVDGQAQVIGGTSAVAPLWAGLVALLNQKRGTRVGFINPFLYQNPQLLRQITSGNNDEGDLPAGYVACVGWNPCCGLGSPNGTALINAE